MKRMLFTALVILALITGTSAAGTGNALFINWRGNTPCDQGLTEGLKELGIALNIEQFNAEQDKAKLEAFLTGLDEKKYDFIYTFGTTVSLKSAEKIKNTPILFGIVTNPVKSGLVQTWENSGNNVTGTSHAISMAEQVDFILSLGKYDKIGMLFNPKEANSQITDKDLADQLKIKGLTYLAYPVETEADIEAALAKADADKAALIYLPSDSFISSQTRNIAPKLTAKGIPTYGANESMVKDGAMIGIVSSYYAVGKDLAKKAALILDGKKPAEIPSGILPLTSQTVLVNTTTAEALKAEIPYAILSSAQFVE